MEISEIVDSESLEKWLEDKPFEWSRAIAARVALKVAPIAWSVAALPDDELPEHYRENLTLLTFRAMFISSAAGTWPAEDMSAAARAASNAAFAASNASNAAFAASNAALAASDASNAAFAASNAASRAALAAARAADAVWASIRGDSAFLQQKRKEIETEWDDEGQDEDQLSAAALLTTPLWLVIDNAGDLEVSIMPNDIVKSLDQFQASQLAQETSFGLVADWYQAVLQGKNTFNKSTTLAIANMKPDAWGDEGSRTPQEVMDHVAKLAGWVGKEPRQEGARNHLAALASPQPELTKEEKLDAVPNREYDKPEVDDDIIELPIRQQALIRSLMAELDQDTSLSNHIPKIVVSAFKEYAIELAARGTQPIIGVLKDQSEIIRKEMAKKHAKEEWCNGGILTACERFIKNDDNIIEHYPLDKEREKEYEQYDVDESQMSDPAFAELLKDTVTIARTAKNEGLTTDQFLRVLEKRAELQQLVASLPEDDTGSKKSSLKKRWALSDIGFFDKLADVAQKSDKIIKSEAGKKLIEKGGEFANFLWSWVKASGNS